MDKYYGIEIKEFLIDIVDFLIKVYLMLIGMLFIFVIIGISIVIFFSVPLAFKFGIESMLKGHLISGLFFSLIGGILTFTIIWGLSTNIIGRMEMRGLNKSWKSFADKFGLKFEKGEVTPDIHGIYRNHIIRVASYKYQPISIDVREISFYRSKTYHAFYEKYTELYVNIKDNSINSDTLKKAFDKSVDNKMTDLDKPVEILIDGKRIYGKWSYFIIDGEKLQSIIDTVIDIAEEIEG